ncbi:MAG: hypothetical protein ACRCSU_15125 [Paracoccaceae bacterium]
MSAPALSIPSRHWFHSIPVIGWIARDLSDDFEGNIAYFLVILLGLLVLAMMKWGLIALGLTALATVPAIFVVLFLITRG